MKLQRIDGKKKSTARKRTKRAPGDSCHGPEARDQRLRHDADTYARSSALLFRIAVEPGGKFRFASANRAFLAATGFKNKQITGRLVGEALPQASAGLAARHFRRAVRTKVAVRWEECVQYPSGLHHVETEVMPMLDDRGSIAQLAGVVHDITARKNAEMALHESEERYRRIAQTAEEGIWTIDARSLTDYVNPKMTRMMGYTFDEMVGRPISDFLDDKGRALLAGHIKRRKKGISEQFEFKFLRKDGSGLWTFVSTNPITDASGAYAGAVALLTDVSARKQAEAGYQRELQFNETLVNHTSAIIVLLDREGRMLHVNDATISIFGYSRKELVGRTPWEVGIMGAGEAVRASERLRRLLKGKVNPAREAILTDKSGRDHVVSLSSVATRSPEGGIDRIIVTGTDLSERYRLQQEILRIAEQEQARIGHNLHDGVGQTMSGVTHLMESLEDELEGAHKESAARIRQLLHDALMEIRRMSHGLSPMSVRNRGLGGALRLLAETIRINHRMPCTSEIDESVRLEDSEKATHVFRIAQEAAGNALRHGRPSKIMISLRRLTDGQCALEVEDDGGGMGGNGRKTGEGIGQQVMDYRANLIRGSLQITSRPRRGVRVVCVFPCT